MVDQNQTSQPKNTAHVSPDSVSRTEDQHLSRGKRLSGHLFWYALRVAMEQGLPQLALFPLCLYLLGAESFGKFVYAMGIVRLVDMSPTRGLVNALFRNVACIPEDKRPVLIRTTFCLAGCAVSGLVVLGLLACLSTGIRNVAESPVSLWVAILILAIAAQNMILLATTDLLVRRRFAQHAIWTGMGGVLAFLALPGLLLIGPIGLPLGYTLGYLVALTVLLFARRTTLLGRPQFDKRMAKTVTGTWMVFSISAILFGSGHYIHRTILGLCASHETVSVFFAAAASLSLCMFPVINLGSFGLQLISAHASMKNFSTRLLTWYPVVAAALAAVFYVLLAWSAPWIVRLLYPAVADSALKPISIMAPGAALLVLYSSAKPFVIRFSMPRAVGTIAVCTLFAHLIPALLLIPPWGPVGAAWAFSIGMSVGSLTWFVFLLVAIRPGEATNRVVSVDDVDFA